MHFPVPLTKEKKNQPLFSVKLKWIFKNSETSFLQTLPR